MDILNIAARFEARMLNVRNAARANDEEFENLANQAKWITKHTIYSLDQVSGSMLFAALRGADAGEIMKSTPGKFGIYQPSKQEK